MCIIMVGKMGVRLSGKLHLLSGNRDSIGSRTEL